VGSPRAALEHGLQGLETLRLHLPRSRDLYPREDYLAERFERFKAA
jgi:hypothetical protein